MNRGDVGILELRLFYKNLQKHEIEVVKRGQVTFGYAYLNRTPFFLYTFDSGILYGDIPFNYHLTKEDDHAPVPNIRHEMHGAMYVLLVNADTGILEALRIVMLSDSFAEKIYTELNEQRKETFDSIIHNARIAQVYQEFPTIEQLFKASSATCVIEPKSRLN
jgi:hypothetical protein